MKKSFVGRALKQIICILMVIVVLAPIILTLFAALKTKGQMVTTSPFSLPPFGEITFDNLKKVLGDKYLLVGLKIQQLFWQSAWFLM